MGKGWGMLEGRQGLDCAGQRATCLRDQVGPFLFSKDCQVGPSSEHMILSQRTATVGATSGGRACWEVLSPQINSINADPSHPPPDNKRGSEAALGEGIVCNGRFSSSLTPKPYGRAPIESLIEVVWICQKDGRLLELNRRLKFVLHWTGFK